MNNPRQIAKFQNNKVILSFTDNLQAETGENAAAIHNDFSKIRVWARDYSNGTGDKAVAATVNLDPEAVKYLAEAILSGKLEKFQESKILGHKKDDEGRSPVTHFSIDVWKKDDGSKQWIFTVTNGTGIASQTDTGGTVVKKGSYKKLGEVKVYMSEMDCFKVLIGVRDYIRNFEICNFARLMQSRDKYEKELKDTKAYEEKLQKENADEE